MKALLYQGPRDIRCESFDDPKLAGERDAIVRMTRCGICGSDLHIYHGQGFSPDIGLKATVFALFMGLIGGLLPATRAARLAIAEATKG